MAKQIEEPAIPPNGPEFEALLDFLKRTRGFDFAAYKRASLTRRVLKRMQDIGIEGYTNYMDYLEVHPDEFGHLFNTILINVTSFFRDASAWEALAKTEIPRILAGKGEHEMVRVWTAGCASGEEAYSIAMLLAEAMGVKEFQARAKIYATDMNETALNKGRLATYSETDVAAIPPALLGKYFEQQGSNYTFLHDLRRAVVFGRHDLIQDAPISRIDILICRNTLMYFNSETQAKILARFSYALNPGGVLFLGKAEMLLTNAAMFTPLDLKRRFFAKAARPGNGAGRPFGIPDVVDPPPPGPPAVDARLRDAALNLSGAAQIVISAAGTVAVVNESARRLFALTDRDLGRPLSDLTVSYRPVELRSCLDRAFAERVPVTVRDVEWSGRGAQPSSIEVVVTPLLDGNQSPIGASITFSDTTEAHRLKEALQQCNQERETANEELQTTNEELQSTVEELETTNEELQSTNEELETMNEELQSTNEELRTSVEELRLRSDELDESRGFWEGVLGGLGMAMIVLDSEFRVRVWNEKAEDMWGLRASEVRGQYLFNLDSGLPVDRLNQPVRQCLTSGKVMRLVADATSRRGRHFKCQITCTPLKGPTTSPQGVTILMDDAAQADGQ